MEEAWKETKVNFLKLIRDLRDQFPYDPLTVLVVETFANSLDAGAEDIKIEITSSGLYQIHDNGKGMDKNEFEEYHNIASLTKKRGSGIGFAGVGAKIYLDRAEYSKTETKSRSFHGSSFWIFYESNAPRWKYIPVENRVLKRGTVVEVKIRDPNDSKRLTEEFVVKTLQKHYNAVLLGYYHTRNVTINGKKVTPWVSSSIETRKDFDFQFRSHRITGFFIKSTMEIPSDFQGPHIVVKGKTVQQHWFKQYPIYPEKFSGLIMADSLISIITGSKAQFKYTSGEWKRFHSKMGRLLSDWLTEIGAKPKPPSVPTELTELARDLEKSINDVLRSSEFKELTKDIFQNLMRRSVSIPSMGGDLSGTEVNGIQMTKGVIGGDAGGQGVPTLGNEEGTGAQEDKTGSVPIEKIHRRVRSGIKIGFDDKPDILKEGWIDPAQQVIIINRGYPSFNVAYGVRAEAYHVLRCAIDTLLEEIALEDTTHLRAAFFSKWFEQQSK